MCPPPAIHEPSRWKSGDLPQRRDLADRQLALDADVEGMSRAAISSRRAESNTTYPKKYQLLGTGEQFLQKIGPRGRGGLGQRVVLAMLMQGW